MLVEENAFGATYPTPGTAYPSATPLKGYNLYTGVMVMMLVGFGYLMTFLKWYGLGAVGFCLLITALGVQCSIFLEAFFAQWYNHSFGQVSLDIYSIFNIVCIIAAPLISFGAVIGKVSPLQLTVMVLFELGFHAIASNCVLNGSLKVSDLGGTVCHR